VQNGTTPNELSIFPLPKERLSSGHALSEGTYNGGAANQEGMPRPLLKFGGGSVEILRDVLL
jgi:hypothetical protein